MGHIGGDIHNVVASNKQAYVAEGPILAILDVSIPEKPKILGKTAPFPENISNIAVKQNLAYVASDWHKLRVIDVSVPSSLTEISVIETERFVPTW